MIENKYFDDVLWNMLSPLAQDVANKTYEFLVKRKELTTSAPLDDFTWQSLVHNVSLAAGLAVDDNFPDHIITTEIGPGISLN